MKISALNNISFQAKKKSDKKPDKNKIYQFSDSEMKQIERGREVTRQLMDCFDDPELQKRMGKIPQQDRLFYDTFQLDRNQDGELEVSGPELLYCRDYASSKGKMETDTLSISTQEDIKASKIIKWLDKVMGKKSSSRN